MKTRIAFLFVLLLVIGVGNGSAFDKKAKSDDEEHHLPCYHTYKRDGVFVYSGTRFDHELPVPVDKAVGLEIQVDNLTPEKFAGKYLAIQITKKGRIRPEKTIRLQPAEGDLNKSSFEVETEYTFREEGEWVLCFGIVDKEKDEFWAGNAIHIKTKKQTTK